MGVVVLGLIAVVPAMILAIIGILVYSAFALLFGSFALAGSATKIAPKRVGLTLGAGAVAFVVAFGWLGAGPGAEDAMARNIETGVISLFSLLIASVAMVVVAGIAALTARFSEDSEINSNDPNVDRQIKQDIEAGGWGLRTTSYSDNQHEQAAAIGREKAKRDARDRQNASISSNTKGW